MASDSKQSTGTLVDIQRDAQIHVKVSEAEKLKFRKMAKERHTDISELIRQLLHREADTKTAKAS